VRGVSCLNVRHVMRYEGGDMRGVSCLNVRHVMRYEGGDMRGVSLSACSRKLSPVYVDMHFSASLTSKTP
jgi:hypothetical protein